MNIPKRNILWTLNVLILKTILFTFTFTSNYFPHDSAVNVEIFPINKFAFKLFVKTLHNCNFYSQSLLQSQKTYWLRKRTKIRLGAFCYIYFSNGGSPSIWIAHFWNFVIFCFSPSVSSTFLVTVSP